MGDANLDAIKWNDRNFPHKNVSIPLRHTLQMCGLKVNDIGITYTADHALKNNKIAESAIDHVYNSENLSLKIVIKKLSNATSDHVPVMTSLLTNKQKQTYERKIRKRSMKNFSSEKWNKCIAEKNWKNLTNCNNVDEMVDIFSNNLNEALDEVAPFKTFTVRSHHKFGLSDETEKTMKKGTIAENK